MDVTGTRKAMIEALARKSPEPGEAIQAFRQLDPDAGDRSILRVLFGPVWIWGLAARLPDIAHGFLDVDASLHNSVLDGLSVAWAKPLDQGRRNSLIVSGLDIGAAPSHLLPALEAIPADGLDRTPALHQVLTSREEMSVRLGAVEALHRVGDAEIVGHLTEMLGAARTVIDARPDQPALRSAMVAVLGLARFRLREDTSVAATLASAYDWLWQRRLGSRSHFDAHTDVSLPALTYPQSQLRLEDCLALATVVAGVRSELPRALATLVIPAAFDMKQRRARLISLLWRLEPRLVPDALREIARTLPQPTSVMGKSHRHLMVDRLGEASAEIGEPALDVFGGLLAHPDEKVRVRVVDGLTRLSGQGARALLETASMDPDRKVAGAATKALKRRSS